MFLKYSDVSWRWMRITDEIFQFLRITDVATRYVYSHFQDDKAFTLDRSLFEMKGSCKEAQVAVDRVRLSYSGKRMDTATSSDTVEMQFAGKFRDFLPPADVLRVSFRSPFAEVAFAPDRVTTFFVVNIHDAVGLNESFFFGGIFNVDINNIAAVLDRATTAQESGSVDSASVAEFVRIGVRHMTDFYLCGFAIGSVVFGGRLR